MFRSCAFAKPTRAGCASDPANLLHKLVPAHSNTVDYAPFLALLFLYFGAHKPSGMIVALVVVATVGRCLVVIGPLAWPTMARPNPARFVGARGITCAASRRASLWSSDPARRGDDGKAAFAETSPHANRLGLTENINHSTR